MRIMLYAGGLGASAMTPYRFNLAGRTSLFAAIVLCGLCSIAGCQHPLLYGPPVFRAVGCQQCQPPIHAPVAGRPCRGGRCRPTWIRDWLLAMKHRADPPLEAEPDAPHSRFHPVPTDDVFAPRPGHFSALSTSPWLAAPPEGPAPQFIPDHGMPLLELPQPMNPPAGDVPPPLPPAG